MPRNEAPFRLSPAISVGDDTPNCTAPLTRWVSTETADGPPGTNLTEEKPTFW
ncbi:hypothetical protein HNR02_005032 [Amycolatopsis endophytica]|uniref:Uncharacterized protein n=1 Tax=Amycolatopsis endophytica TaxID=860233 RepID=A0A853B996_9PSEU|nr:hypothetical protein [Amycolatopsis endophytica]NYI91709.1 hypothetical protein [Amycolatopsis endophytica]